MLQIPQAHIGCFVPAQEAVIGITDCILTRLVSTDSSTAGGQSTFMIDLRQMAMMLQKATPRSLLIVDEFGKVCSTYLMVHLLSYGMQYSLILSA